MATEQEKYKEREAKYREMINNQSKEIEKLSRALDQSSLEVSKLKHDLKDAENNLSTKVSSYETQIQDIKNRFDRLICSSDASKIVQQLEDKDEEIHYLTEQYEEKEKAYETATKLVKDYEEAITKLSHIIDEQRTKISELELVHDKNYADAECQTDGIETINNSCQTDDIKLNIQRSPIETINNSCQTDDHNNSNDYEVKYNKLQTYHAQSIHNFKDIMNVLKTNTARKDEIIEELTNELNSLKNNSIDQKIQNMEKELETYRTGLFTRNLEKQIVLLNTKVQNLENDLILKMEHINALEESVKQMKPTTTTTRRRKKPE
jgi:tetratricopeptide (TPR) repeat protein